MAEETVKEGRSGGWWGRVKEELTPQKNLLLLKAVLTLQTFGAMCALPYLTVHMRQLGVTYTELSTISALLPISGILGPPISGLVADKTSRYKLVICFNIVMAALTTVLLLYVPARPSRTLNLTCHPDGHILTWSSCDLCHHHRNNTFLQLLLEDCEWSCSSPPAEMQMCFTGHNDTCLRLSSDTQVQVNGTVVSGVEGETCNHELSEVWNEGHVFYGLTCPAQCPISCRVANPPSCLDPRDSANNPATFWLYLGVRLLWNIFTLCSFSMLDATTLAIIKVRGGDFGKQRVLPMIAGSIATAITGAIVDWYSAGKGYSDFTPAMYLSAIILLASAALVSRLHFTVERTENRMIADLRRLVTNVKVDAFFVVVFLFGTNWGFIDTFLFVFLKDLGAPNYLMGTSVLVSQMFAMPVIFLGDTIVRKVGYHTLFAFSFFVYAFREFTYSTCTNPWVVVGLESVKVLSTNLPWITMLRLCPDLGPKGLIATLTGIVSPIHFIIGGCAGAFIGGLLVDALGLVDAFRTFSYASLSCGGLYLLIYFCYIRHRRKGAAVVKVEEAAPMVVYTSTDNNTTTPDTHTTTPDAHIFTSENHITTPDNHIITQDDHITTPQNHTSSPENCTTTHDHTTTYGNHTTIYGNYSTTPDDYDTTPDNHNTTPDNHTTKSDNYTTTPDNHTTTPDNHTTTPDSHNTTPYKLTTTPLHQEM